MSNIDNLINSVRTAVYGKEVRGSIADAIEDISERQDIADANEIVRQEHESTRESNETTRQSHESTRESNESTRVSNEETRQTHESTRESNETTRQSHESTRESNESTRLSNEETRQTHESTRESNETTRQSNESTRQSNEETRQTHESTRESNESTRQSNESTRESNESNRTSAELTRVNDFNLIKDQYNDAIANMESKTFKYEEGYYQSTSNGTTTFYLNATSFNPITDTVELYYSDGTRLTKGKEYTIDGTLITLSGWTIDNGDFIAWIARKGTTQSDPPGTNGADIMNGSIRRASLESSVLNELSTIITAEDFTDTEVTVDNDIHPLIQNELDRIDSALTDIAVNVTSFGAKGDGVTDDTTAIQNAINSLTTGQTLNFPSGVYMCNSLLLENKTNIILTGYLATLKLKDDTTLYTRLFGYIRNINNLKILGLTFDGNKEHVAGSASAGCGTWEMWNCTNVLLKNIKVCNSNYGVCTFIDCHNIDIIDSKWDTTDVCIYAPRKACTDVNINNCEFVGGTSEGIGFASGINNTDDLTNYGYHENIKITNCKFKDKDGIAIGLTNVKNVFIGGNEIIRVDNSKSSQGISLCLTDVPIPLSSDTINIISNSIINMLANPIKVTGGVTNCNISHNNLLITSSKINISGDNSISFTNNLIDGTLAVSGLAELLTVKKCNISNNTFNIGSNSNITQIATFQADGVIYFKNNSIVKTSAIYDIKIVNGTNGIFNIERNSGINSINNLSYLATESVIIDKINKIGNVTDSIEYYGLNFDGCPLYYLNVTFAGTSHLSGINNKAQLGTVIQIIITGGSISVSSTSNSAKAITSRTLTTGNAIKFIYDGTLWQEIS